jgi:diaphanous 1
MTSNKIQTLFSVILRVGNYINGGGCFGGLYGFKFESLEKLNDCKSNKSHYTIVHYIYEVMKSNYQESCDFTDLLENLKKCKRIDLDTICSSINDLSSRISKCEDFKDQAKELVQHGDLFYPKFDTFQKTFGNKLNNIKRMLEDCIEKCREVILFYGETPDKVKIGVFIAQFYLFVFNYVKAGDALEREKQDKEMARLREAQQTEEVEKHKNTNKSTSDRNDNPQDISEKDIEKPFNKFLREARERVTTNSGKSEDKK